MRTHLYYFKCHCHSFFTADRHIKGCSYWLQIKRQQSMSVNLHLTDVSLWRRVWTRFFVHPSVRSSLRWSLTLNNSCCQYGKSQSSERTTLLGSMVKTATSQDGDSSKRRPETATEMAIGKMATNPNNTYSSSEAYRIDRRLYTIIWHASVKLYEKSTIFHHAQCLMLVRNRFEPMIFN